ncbi:hypothetical protein HOY34_11050 [Xinfangfangia sp. D13-10-4-6]|uniref:hypothetical protein n=1 Tax=Pseudogemmobacter hezensis TaxID=2737662 RepID=UPI0015567CF8|nr:hypothetical protein [Pseudogemmobacter hezensis]NPD15739.1 hypothetical protein [Pseudogemmobacter hezensis]
MSIKRTSIAAAIRMKSVRPLPDAIALRASKSFPTLVRAVELIGEAADLPQNLPGLVIEAKSIPVGMKLWPAP